MISYNRAIEGLESLTNYCRSTESLKYNYTYDISKLVSDCLLIVFTLYDSDNLALHKAETLHKMLTSRNNENIFLAAELIINLKILKPKPSVMQYDYGYLIWYDLHYKTFEELLTDWKNLYDNND